MHNISDNDLHTMALLNLQLENSKLKADNATLKVRLGQANLQNFFLSLYKKYNLPDNAKISPNGEISLIEEGKEKENDQLTEQNSDNS